MSGMHRRADRECHPYRKRARGKQPWRCLADNLGMSLPRAILPGRCYMITRRCSERRFFMRPDRETNNAFVYCLALAARKASVSIVDQTSPRLRFLS